MESDVFSTFSCLLDVRMNLHEFSARSSINSSNPWNKLPVEIFEKSKNFQITRSNYNDKLYDRSHVIIKECFLLTF